MTTQPDLFGEPEPAPVEDPHTYLSRHAPATSVAASAAAYPRSGTQRRRVLEAILEATNRGHGGATDPELQRHLDMSPNSERPRRLELVEQGYVVDSGKTRREHGRDHIVWGATPRAAQASERVT